MKHQDNKFQPKGSGASFNRFQAFSDIFCTKISELGFDITVEDDYPGFMDFFAT